MLGGAILRVKEREWRIVRKLNAAGETELTWSGEVLENTSEWVKIEARFDRYDRLDLGYTVFERGDRFVEWFFADRWYTIYEIHARADDHLKGWYCNITHPAELANREVRTVDLALDLWVESNGKMKILDEDEFASLDLPDANRNSAWGALADLQHLVQSRCPPFDQIRGSRA